MAQEIERKFLVSGEFKSLATKALTIKQGYLCANAGRTVSSDRSRAFDA